MVVAVIVAVIVAVLLALAWAGNRVRRGSTGVRGHRDTHRDDAIAQHAHHANQDFRGGGPFL